MAAVTETRGSFSDTRHAPLIALLLLLSMALLARWQMQPIKALPEQAPDTVFSAGRAFVQLEALLAEQLPHPVDSRQNGIVGQRIVSMLKALKLPVEIQTRPVCQSFAAGDAETAVSEFHRCAQVRNIVVHIPGSTGATPILLSTHYDSVPAGPGASDPGAAVATLLEIARLLSLSAPPRNGIVLLFNDGEEFGLLGAKAFMEQHPLAKGLQLAINVEARGSSGKSVMFETGEDSGWLVRHYAETTPAPFSSSLFYELYKILPNDTDLTLYKAHGLQGLNFAHADRETHYHTPLDNLSTLHRGSLQHHGDNVWGLLERIKDLDLSAVTPGNVVFTDVLRLFIVSWDEAFSLWLALGLAGLWLLLGWRQHRIQPLAAKSTTIALASMLLVPVTAGLSAWALQQVTLWLSASPEPWRSNSLPMQLAVWSAAVLGALWMGQLLMKKARSAEQMLGQSLFWVLLALVSSVVMPGASFLAIVPAGISLLGWLVALSRARWRYATRISLGILFPLASALCFIPLALELELLMSFHLAPVQGVSLGLALSGILPLLTHRHPSPIRLTALRGLLSLLLLSGALWTCLQAAYTPWMPQHLNLRYVQQTDQPAYVLIDSSHENIPATLATALGEVKQGRILPWLEPNSRYRPVNTLNLPVTELEVLADLPQDKGRTVNIRLHTPTQDAEIITLFIPPSAGLTRIDSHATRLHYPAAGQGQYQIYQCVGLSCNDLELTLTLRTQEKTKVRLLHSAHGLPEALRALALARGDLAVERQNGDRRIVASEVIF